MKSSGNTSSSTSFTQLTGTFSFPLELSVSGVSLPYLVGGSYWYSRLEFGFCIHTFLNVSTFYSCSCSCCHVLLVAKFLSLYGFLLGIAYCSMILCKILAYLNFSEWCE